jgi:hypothetical protein
MRGLLHVARNFLCRRSLFRRRGRDVTAVSLTLLMGLDHGLDRLCGDPRCILEPDLRADLLGRLGGLGGQRFEFGGDRGEALADVVRPRDLDRGVQRKPVGLSGDLADDLHHAADSFRRAGQVFNLLVRLNGLPQPLFDEAPRVTC